MSHLFFLYNLAVLAVLGAVLLSLVVNLLVFKSLQPARPASSGGLVSILVPARNEESRIRRCVESLQAQDYAHCELLVLDDNSEDRTAEILREIGFIEGDAKRRLIHGQPLPLGWTGKNWACHQLAAAAKGDYLLFTDADTVHSPPTVSAAIAFAKKNRADLLSAWPRLVMLTWSERLVIPMIHLLAAALYPHALILFFQNLPPLAKRVPPGLLRSLGAANGQFLFFKRSAYEKIGGHQAVRGHLVEDVALGRELAQRMADGMRLVNCDASRFVECRMYERFRDVWEGFTKNLRPAFEDSLALFLAVGAVQFACFFLPCVLVFFLCAQWRLVAGQVALIYLIRLILTLRFRTSWFGFVFHPVGHALAMLIALNSWRRVASGGVTWKGRNYKAAG
jgi:chlorobactene glucosyltransferase